MSNFRRRILQTANDDSSYIKDGLVFWLDGLDKQQTGSYVWVDKIGGIGFTNDGGVTELPNGFSFNGTTNSILTGSKTLTSVSDTRNGTVEIVLHPKLTTNWSPIVCFSRWDVTSERNNYLVITFMRQGVNGCPFDNVKYCINAANYGYKCSNNKLQAFSLQYNTYQYINTEKVTDYQTNDTGPASNRGYCRIGASVDGSNRVIFNGDIHEIRVYNRKLTDKERLHNQQIDVKRYNIPIGQSWYRICEGGIYTTDNAYINTLQSGFQSGKLRAEVELKVLVGDYNVQRLLSGACDRRSYYLGIPTFGSLGANNENSFGSGILNAAGVASLLQYKPYIGKRVKFVWPATNTGENNYIQFYENGEYGEKLHASSQYNDGNYTTTYNMYIFGYNMTNSLNYSANDIVIYSTTAMNNSITKYDMKACQLTEDIPAELAWDNKIHYAGEYGMYDEVTGKFFGNANSTGHFIENID